MGISFSTEAEENNVSDPLASVETSKEGEKSTNGDIAHGVSEESESFFHGSIHGICSSDEQQDGTSSGFVSSSNTASSGCPPLLLTRSKTEKFAQSSTVQALDSQFALEIADDLGTQHGISRDNRSTNVRKGSAIIASDQNAQYSGMNPESKPSAAAETQSSAPPVKLVNVPAPVHHRHNGANPQVVQHDYHDHGADPTVDPKTIKHKAKGGVVTPFPVKLHSMLDMIEADGLAHVVSWQPHGRCFVVHKTKEFVNHIMPKYFKQSKMASFQRQLNLYGFSRLTGGIDKGGYYHELFLRGKVSLAYDIHRMRVKGTGVRLPANPDKEPNFYALPPIQQNMVASLPTSQPSMPVNKQEEKEIVFFEGCPFHCLDSKASDLGTQYPGMNLAIMTDDSEVQVPYKTNATTASATASANATMGPSGEDAGSSLSDSEMLHLNNIQRNEASLATGTSSQVALHDSKMSSENNEQSPSIPIAVSLSTEENNVSDPPAVAASTAVERRRTVGLSRSFLGYEDAKAKAKVGDAESEAGRSSTDTKGVAKVGDAESAEEGDIIRETVESYIGYAYNSDAKAFVTDWNNYSNGKGYGHSQFLAYLRGDYGMSYENTKSLLTYLAHIVNSDASVTTDRPALAALFYVLFNRRFVGGFIAEDILGERLRSVSVDGSKIVYGGANGSNPEENVEVEENTIVAVNAHALVYNTRERVITDDTRDASFMLLRYCHIVNDDERKYVKLKAPSDEDEGNDIEYFLTTARDENLNDIVQPNLYIFSNPGLPLARFYDEDTDAFRLLEEELQRMQDARSAAKQELEAEAERRRIEAEAQQELEDERRRTEVEARVVDARPLAKRKIADIDLTDVPPQPPIPKSKGLVKEGASKYTGVSFDKKMMKWRALITFEGKHRHIGYYVNEEEAGIDYARALFKCRSQRSSAEAEAKVAAADESEAEHRSTDSHGMINVGDAESEAKGRSTDIEAKERVKDVNPAAKSCSSKAEATSSSKPAAKRRRFKEKEFEIDLTDVPPQPPIPKSKGKVNEGASNYTGVYFHKTAKKWAASITIEGKNRHIGYYLNEEEAAIDYARALFKYRPNEAFNLDLTDVPPQPPIPKSKGKVKEGASKYTGVSFDKKMMKWRAQITIEGKLRHIGYYVNEEEAGIDYARAFFKCRSQRSSAEAEAKVAAADESEAEHRSTDSHGMINVGDAESEAKGRSTDIEAKERVKDVNPAAKSCSSKAEATSSSKPAAKRRRFKEKEFEIDLTDVPPQPPIPKSKVRMKEGAPKYTGVTFDNVRKNWSARIWIDGKNRTIGRYLNEEEAAIDYARALFKYRPNEAFNLDLTDVPPQPPIPKSKGKVKEGASKYTGVSFEKKRMKWKARIRIEGKYRHIGYYVNEEEAGIDYARALFKCRSQRSSAEAEAEVAAADESEADRSSADTVVKAKEGDIEPAAKRRRTVGVPRSILGYEEV